MSESFMDQEPALAKPCVGATEDFFPATPDVFPVTQEARLKRDQSLFQDDGSDSKACDLLNGP